MIINITNDMRVLPYGKDSLQGWTIERYVCADKDTKEHKKGEWYWYNDSRHWYSCKIEHALIGAMNILMYEDKSICDISDAIEIFKKLTDSIIIAVNRDNP